ncbi:MAG: diadenylate cyclase [Candidatus Omnitrophota bacterium]|jgi:diadenylate cyclase
MGHDGAVIIEGNRITDLMCHLPLSKTISKIGKGGTRHAAALGLVELSDALCLVVSEERGIIKLARHGELTSIKNAEMLTLELERFYQEIYPQNTPRPREDYIKKNFREKIIAIALALGLWFVNVYGSDIVYKTFTIPVNYVELQKPWIIEEIEPKNADITFHGPQNAFYFKSKDDIKLVIKLKLEEGYQWVRLYSENLKYPEDMVFDDFNPLSIRVKLKKKAEAKPEKTEPGILAIIADKTKEILPSADKMIGDIKEKVGATQ